MADKHLTLFDGEHEHQLTFEWCDGEWRCAALQSAVGRPSELEQRSGRGEEHPAVLAKWPTSWRAVVVTGDAEIYY